MRIYRYFTLPMNPEIDTPVFGCQAASIDEADKQARENGFDPDKLGISIMQSVRGVKQEAKALKKKNRTVSK